MCATREKSLNRLSLFFTQDEMRKDGDTFHVNDEAKGKRRRNRARVCSVNEEDASQASSRTRPRCAKMRSLSRRPMRDGPRGDPTECCR